MAFWTKDEKTEAQKTDQPGEKKEQAPNSNLQRAPLKSSEKQLETDSIPEKKTTAVTTTRSGDVETALSQRFGKLRSALGEGTVIQGKLSFDTPVRIDGKLSGEIFSSDALIIGKQGEIDAQVEVGTLIVMGNVKGSIKAREIIEIYSTGSVQADIETPKVYVEEGGRFDGKCVMGKAGVKKESAADNQKKETASSVDTAKNKSTEVRVH